MTEPTEPKMRRDFSAGGGFAVLVPDVPEPAPPEPPAAAAPAETGQPATDDDEEVPPEGDCDGCAKRP